MFQPCQNGAVTKAKRVQRTQRRTDALSKERIIETAIEILDTEGESALTFRALAARLATGSGAIYWHVANKDELLAAADVLGVFLVFSERSRNTLRGADLAKVKPGAILVNISRGPIVEEQALIEALRSGHLAGAGLDVFDREPLPADHPFRSLDNVVVTPHIGYVTEHLFRTAWQRMAEDVAAYLRGTPIRVVTDPADCPPMAPQ